MLGEHAARVNGVHVRDQQDFLCPLASECRTHHVADFPGRVFHLVNIARFHELDLAAESLQTASDESGEFTETFEIAATGLDGNQRLQAFEQRGFFLLCQ